jgi:hypothetical protein
MALGIVVVRADWRTKDNIPQDTKDRPVIALGFGDSADVKKNVLPETTRTQREVEEFMKKVNQYKRTRLFMPPDAALVTFPAGRKMEFLALGIKSNNMTLAEPFGRDLKVVKNDTVERGKINLVVLEGTFQV